MPQPKKKPHKDAAFVEYVVDALSGINGIRAKSMFGGFGVYVKEDFIGIVSDGTLYFRVSDATRPRYEKHGSKPFVYSRDGKHMTMSYFEVPADVLEDHEQILAWGEEALTVTKAAKAAKKKRA